MGVGDHGPLSLLRLHQAVEAAGIPIHGLDKDGNIHFKDDVTPQQRRRATQMVGDFDLKAARQAAEHRAKYDRLAHLKAVRAEADAAGDTVVAQQIQTEIDALETI